MVLRIGFLQTHCGVERLLLWGAGKQNKLPSKTPNWVCPQLLFTGPNPWKTTRNDVIPQTCLYFIEEWRQTNTTAARICLSPSEGSTEETSASQDKRKNALGDVPALNKILIRPHFLFLHFLVLCFIFFHHRVD